MEAGGRIAQTQQSKFRPHVFGGKNSLPVQVIGADNWTKIRFYDFRLQKISCVN